MDWLKSIGIWVKNIFTLISRVMKLEGRVSDLEKKMDAIQSPPKDLKNDLEYNKEWNYYRDKTIGEQFCHVCIGNNKKITISWNKNSFGEGWNCQNCKASEWKDNPGYNQHPEYGIND